MTTSPSWLADFQKQWSEGLRCELATAGGQLRAGTALPNSWRDLRIEGDARRRWSAYNQQYWYRLFTALQREYPLSARLLGFWSFNQLAMQFFAAHPPQHYDLQRCTEGWVDFLRSCSFPKSEFKAALLEGSELDRTIQRVFLAPKPTNFELRLTEPSDLLPLRLIPSPSSLLFEENWPLLAERTTIIGTPGEGQVPLPPRLPTSQIWSVYRQGLEVHFKLLLPAQAAFYRLLSERTIGEALLAWQGQLERFALSDPAAAVELWLRESVADGMWSGSFS